MIQKVNFFSQLCQYSLSIYIYNLYNLDFSPINSFTSIFFFFISHLVFIVTKLLKNQVRKATWMKIED